MADSQMAVRGQATLALRAKNVHKVFNGIEVLHGVDLEVPAGARHAVVGENGAGKSTLMKIICGILEPEAGEIEVFGEALPRGLRAAQRAGLALVHQELSLVPTLSIAENCALGHLPARNGIVSWSAVREAGRRAMSLVGLDLDTDTIVEELSFAERQLVEIGRALMATPRILVLDEPTSALSPEETSRLFRLLTDLNRDHGTTIIFISHRVVELYSLCDSATVLRDGNVVACFSNLAAVSQGELVMSMVGRQLDLRSRRTPVPADKLGPVVLEASGLSGPGVKDFGLTIRAGEVVGLGGMMGSGRTELARLVVGLARPSGGTLAIDGKQVRIRSMKDARSLGIAYVPEDRQKEGLALVLSTGVNAMTPSIGTLSPAGIIRRRRSRQLAARVLEENDVRPRGENVIAGRLSGGNQQKLVLGKWLPTNPRLLILDEPTRGVDVQARSQIHQRIDALARQGTAILLISSELPELLTVSDRIVVMCEGRLMGQVDPGAWTEESVISLATGHKARET